ncbi:MAG: TetR/AcrR family transcriptional regulator [Desulfatibacillaceae bacterium]
MVKTKIKDPELIQKRQRQICAGAMKVFKNKGFHATSIREIAKASRISLGSLYDYIEKKEDILFLVHKQILDEIYDVLDETIKQWDDPVDQLVHAARQLFGTTMRLQDEVLFIYTETKSLEKDYLHEILQREAEFVGRFQRLIEDGVQKGAFHCPQPAICANTIAYLLAIVALRGWNILPYHGEQELLDHLLRVILKSVGVDPAKAGI